MYIHVKLVYTEYIHVRLNYVNVQPVYSYVMHVCVHDCIATYQTI